MEKKEIISVTFIILGVIGIITTFILATNSNNTEVKEQIIDCQSRGNELKWCLDLIK